MPLFEFISKRIPRGGPPGLQANGNQRSCSLGTEGSVPCAAAFNYPALQRHAFYTVPLVLYAGLIFFLSSLSRVPALFPPVILYDKFLHFLEYAPFGYLIMRMLVTSPHRALARRAALRTVIFGAIFGVLDEFHQSFVPERDASALDVLADVAGVAAAAFAYRKIRSRLSWVRIVEDDIEKGFSHGE